jgi:hypothetical protein
MQRVSDWVLVFFWGAAARRWGGAASTLWALAAAVRARPFPLHIKKALASKWYYTISRYKRSFRAAASALWALAAAIRVRPFPLHIKKALASKWY